MYIYIYINIHDISWRYHIHSQLDRWVRWQRGYDMGIVYAVGQNFMTLVQMDGLVFECFRCLVQKMAKVCNLCAKVLGFDLASDMEYSIEDFLHCCGETVTVMSYWHLDSMHLHVYQSDRLLCVILPLCWWSHVFTYTNFGFLLIYHIKSCIYVYIYIYIHV